MIEVIKASCWDQKFVPKGFSALAPGLYTCIKSLKLYKIRFRTDHFETCNIWAKRKGLSVWFVCSCLGLYTCEKKTHKTRFFLNWQQMGIVIRNFCWHQNFVPMGLSVPALWLYTLQSLYNATSYNTILVTTRPGLAPKWSFSYSFFMNLSLYNTVHL